MPPLEERFNVLPEHRALLLAAVAVGRGFTVTVVLAVAEHPFAPVTITVYVPEFTTAEFEIVGFCCVEVKLLGPDQL